MEADAGPALALFALTIAALFTGAARLAPPLFLLSIVEHQLRID
jgi:hypothetical protein